LSESQTRYVSFANRTIELNYHEPEIATIVTFLFRDISETPKTPPDYLFQLTYQHEHYILEDEQTVICKTSSVGNLASHLLSKVGYHLADGATQGLFFHAAGLCWQGQGVMFPAQSGSGKTTLITWLLTQGFTYLTDEFMFVPDDNDETTELTTKNIVQGFRRPLNLKRPSTKILDPFFCFETHANKLLDTPEGHLIPADLVGTIHATDTVPLKLIILPQYGPDQTFMLHPLSKARAGLKLLETVINARNLPRHGVPYVTHLGKQIPVYQLQYSNFEQLKPELDDLIQQILT